MSDELFSVPVQKSPKLRWMERHRIKVKHFQDVEPGDEDEFENEVYPYVARKADFEMYDLVPDSWLGVGNTEDEALVDYARKRGLLLWNEEDYVKHAT